MAKKIKIEHKKIIPISAKSFWTKFLITLTLTTVCLTGLSIMSAGVLERLANPVRFANKYQIFIHIFPENNDAKTSDKTQLVINTLQSIDGISNVTLVPKEKIQSLIKPIISTENLPLLPIPIILNVKLNSRFSLSVEELKQRLLEKTTNVTVESEVGLLKRLTSAVVIAQGISWFIPVLGFIIISSAIAILVAGILLAYRSTLEVLYNLGTYRSTIVYTFAKHILKYSIYGGYIGIAISFIVIAIISYFLGSSALLFPSLITIIVLLALPLFVSIIAFLISIIVINKMLDGFFYRRS